MGETETHCTGAQVTGLRAGAVANRQTAIYDKRAEILEKHGKIGWLEIWNATRINAGQPPLDLQDRDQSQVWRFELRMGSKQLRNRWEMRSWIDLDAMVGDAFCEFCERIRYCIPTSDRNRSRWPTHELWEAVTEVVGRELGSMRSGVVPDDVKTANREEHKRMLDAQILGLMVSRAAAEGIDADDVEGFLSRHVVALKDVSRAHPAPIAERYAKAATRYRFR